MQRIAIASNGRRSQPVTTVKKTPIGMIIIRVAMPTQSACFSVSCPDCIAPLPPLNGVRTVFVSSLLRESK